MSPEAGYFSDSEYLEFMGSEVLSIIVPEMMIGRTCSAKRGSAAVIQTSEINRP